MIKIGGVWLFAMIASYDPSLPTQPSVIHRRYDTAAQCELAKEHLLKQYPQAYVACDR